MSLTELEYYSQQWVLLNPQGADETAAQYLARFLEFFLENPPPQARYEGQDVYRPASQQALL